MLRYTDEDFLEPRGNFESLMHRIQSPALRAIAQHWHEARGDNRIPSWTDLSSSALSPYSKMLWGFQYDPKAGEFRGWLAGDKLRKWVDDDFRGGLLQDLAPGLSYEPVKVYLTRIMQGPLAFRCSGRLFEVDGFVVTGERIALPLAEDRKSGDVIFGASDYVAPPLLGPVKLVHENLEWYEI